MPASLNTQSTRDSLNGFIGQAAVDFGLFTPQQQERALEIQARFLALPEGARPQATPELLADDAQWVSIPETVVSNEQMLAARAQVKEGKGMPRSVPPLGEIAFKLGYAKSEDRHAILAAQAGERTLRAVERARATRAEPIGEQQFVDVVTSPKWNPIAQPGNPSYVQSAQTANCKAEMLEAAIALAPEMLQNGDVNLSVQQGLTALEGIATTSYKNAAQSLATNQHLAVAARLNEAANDIAQQKSIEHAFSFELTPTRMRAADQALGTALNYLVSHQKISAPTLESLMKGTSPTSDLGNAQKTVGITR